jgi:hypothetical protein
MIHAGSPSTKDAGVDMKRTLQIAYIPLGGFSSTSIPCVSGRLRPCFALDDVDDIDIAPLAAARETGRAEPLTPGTTWRFFYLGEEASTRPGA